jgi:hypothetical protein
MTQRQKRTRRKRLRRAHSLCEAAVRAAPTAGTVGVGSLSVLGGVPPERPPQVETAKDGKGPLVVRLEQLEDHRPPEPIPEMLVANNYAASTASAVASSPAIRIIYPDGSRHAS